MNQGDANSQASGGTFNFKKRRRSVRKKKTLTAADVKRIAASQVRKSLEHKHFDDLTTYSTISSAYPLAGAGVVEDCTEIEQGVLDTERTGDQLTYTSWQVRVLVYTPDSTAQSSGCFIRMIGFLWRESSTPTIVDILQSGNLGITELVSSYHHHTKTMRKILFDKTVTLFDRSVISGGTIGVRSTQNNWVEKFYVNLTTTLKKEDRVLTFDPAAGTVGYNKLYIATLTNIGSQAAGWNINMYSTVMYLDG